MDPTEPTTPGERAAAEFLASLGLTAMEEVLVTLLARELLRAAGHLTAGMCLAGAPGREADRLTNLALGLALKIHTDAVAEAAAEARARG